MRVFSSMREGVKDEQYWIERREFGRREMRVQAVAHIPGRPPAYCIVRDLSAGGAFLEFYERLRPSVDFRLVIASRNIDVMCEVRHHRSGGVGVMFDRIQTAEIIPPMPPISVVALRRAIIGSVANKSA